jgi:hypothetical protein
MMENTWATPESRKARTLARVGRFSNTKRGLGELHSKRCEPVLEQQPGKETLMPLPDLPQTPGSAVEIYPQNLWINLWIVIRCRGGSALVQGLSIFWVNFGH